MPHCRASSSAAARLRAIDATLTSMGVRASLSA
jgi:hypothetical protein